MQTFLPFPSFISSAESIDKKRCWKQCVEAKQILDCLEGKKVGWANHPAVKMWDGHILALREYFNAFLFVSVDKHNINTQYEEYDYPCENSEEHSGLTKEDYPWWLGNEDFHRAMRARLIVKDKDFYLPQFPDDEDFNEGKYFWPVMETKTFRII